VERWSLRSWIGVGSLVLVACSRPGGGADGGSETGDTGETGGPGELVCDEEWEEAERRPYFVLASHGSPELYVAVAFEHIISFDGDTWTTTPIEENVYASHVWASAPDEVWFIDVFSAEHRLVHWDGTALTELAKAEAGVSLFDDVWGSGPDDVWLAGRRDCSEFLVECQPLLRRYDGEEFTDVTGHGLQEPSAVWGRGPDDVFVGSRSGMTAHYDGATWTQEPMGTDPVGHIVGDDSMIYAVAYPKAYRWYGQGWSVIAGDVPNLCDTAATASGRLWCSWYGDQGFAVWDTGIWTVHQDSSIEVKTLANHAGEVWVSLTEAGHDGSASFVTADADGELTPRKRLDYVGEVHAIGGSSLDGVVAMAEAGVDGLAQWGADGWSWRTLDDTFEVWAMQVEDEGRELWTVGRSTLPGEGDFVLRRETPDGDEQWPLPDGVAGTLLGLWVEAPDDVWVLDQYGAHHFDGTSWFAVPVPLEEPSVELVTAGGHIYLRTFTRLYELVRGMWTPLLSTAGLRDIDARGPDSLWVIDRPDGGDDVVRHWDGAQWITHELGQYTLTRLDVKGPDDVYLIGYRVVENKDPLQRVLHWNGERWKRIPAPYVPGAHLLVMDDGIMLEDSPLTYTVECERR
jgi:hypothetical protein